MKAKKTQYEISENLIINEKQYERFTSIQARSFSLSTQSLNLIDCRIRCVKNNVKHFAYVLHDKDFVLDEFGVPTSELKKSHIHVIITYTDARSALAVVKDFLTTEVSALPDTCKYERFLYLTHESPKAIEEGKVKYDKDSVISDDVGYWLSYRSKSDLKRDKEDLTLDIIDDINKSISLRILAKKYGRDVVVNFSKYRDFALALKHQDETHVFNPDGSIKYRKVIVFDGQESGYIEKWLDNNNNQVEVIDDDDIF